HTVFGQVIDGMDVVDEIAKVKKNKMDKPLEDVVINTIDTDGSIL
ncbi:MAG: peptidylprolyl isomerase, partial [Lactobacillus amylovorus]